MNSGYGGRGLEWGKMGRGACDESWRVVEGVLVLLERSWCVVSVADSLASLCPLTSATPSSSPHVTGWTSGCAASWWSGGC